MPVELPSELQEEILTRVPCKSLGRFRSVCKSWNSLLLEDRFVRKNFYHTSSYGDEHRFVFYFWGDLSTVGDEEQQQNVVHDLTLHNVREGLRIRMYRILHCDGLLLSIMGNQLLVWNPLLKETRWIKCGSEFHEKDDAYGLGYIDYYDYRIVRFRCATNRKTRPPRVEVYEFATKTWKVIDITSFDWHLRVPISMVSLKGTPYFIGLRHNHHTAFVQSFDFSKERFQPIADLPFKYVESNPIALESFRGDRLSVLEQCLQTGKICIWVKHLLIPSWTRFMVVTIPLFPLKYPSNALFSKNYFVDKNSRLIITSLDDDDVGLSINRVSNNKDFETQRVMGVDSSSSCNYFPSLIRIPGFRKQDTSKIRLRKNRFN